jgi:hypothetical protein
MIDVIRECLDEEDGQNVSQPPPSSSSQSTIPSSKQFSQVELPLANYCWREDDFPPLEPSGDVKVDSLALDRGRLFHRTEYLSVGISTDCTLGFFRSKESVTLVCLEKRSVVRRIACQDLKVKDLKDVQIVLSQHFLAVGAADALLVLDCAPPTYSGPTSVEKFELGWTPDCLAISDGWISIGGRVFVEGGVMHSSIKLYQIDRTATTRPFRIHSEGLGSQYLKSDFLQTLEIRPDGNRLAALTNNNRILIWDLSDLRSVPFMISRKYAIV